MEPFERKMTVPEVQAHLHRIANEIHDNIHTPDLHYLADQLFRRKAVRKAPTQSQPMTNELRFQIIDYWRANLKMSYAAIASHFNVNPGRVSEAVRWWQN